jgi:broad specificity phosphatase PhoE
MRLLLVRHCEPVPESRGRCYGSLDFGLSEAGHTAARQITSPWPLDTVVSSPRRRALETAASLAADVRVDDRLRELDFGELEGLTYEEVERTQPELYAQWMDAPTTVRFPGGESYADLRARVLEAIEDLEGTVAVVTHGGPIRAILAHCLRMPDDAIFRLAIDYGSRSVVEWLDGVPVVRAVNVP